MTQPLQCPCPSNMIDIPVSSVNLRIDPEQLPQLGGLSREEVLAIVEDAVSGLTPGSGTRILWESDWFDIAANTGVNFAHGLNVQTPEHLQPTVVARFKTALSDWAVGDIMFLEGADYVGSSGNTETGYVTCIDAEKIYISFGNNTYLTHGKKNGGFVSIPKTALQCKAIIRG